MGLPQIDFPSPNMCDVMEEKMNETLLPLPSLPTDLLTDGPSAHLKASPPHNFELATPPVV